MKTNHKRTWFYIVLVNIILFIIQISKGSELGFALSYTLVGFPFVIAGCYVGGVIQYKIKQLRKN